MNYTQFAQRIKNKYPQYQDIDDLELANKVISKYPQYQQVVEFDTTSIEQPPIEQTPIEQTPQEQYIQDENLIQKLARLDRESSERAEQRMRERGIKDPNVPTVPEILKGALNLASYMPVGAPVKLGKYAKAAYELGVPATLGAGARYIEEREKEQTVEDAAKTSAKQATAEIATGVALKPVFKLGKDALTKLTKAIPDDIYKKAKQFSQDTAKPLTERIDQLKNLGKKASQTNQKFNSKMQNLAEKAAEENKNTARKISDTMNKISKQFFDKNLTSKLVDQTKNIPDSKIDDLIQKEHNRLIKSAKPLKEPGGKKRNREAEALLDDFRNRFMTKKTTTKTRLQQSKKEPSLLVPIKEEITEYTTIKNRNTFFKEMRLISDKSTFGEGKKAVGQSYAKIHKTFNDFLKENSLEYKSHKELGQLLVNFSKFKSDVADVYDTNKIQNAIKETLESFDKTPDPDSVVRLDNFLKQAKKYKYKTDIDLKKYNKNLELMKFEKSGTKGLTKEQINALPSKIKEKYLKNEDLTELTKQPLFTGKQKAQQVATDPSKMGRIMELLPPELRKDIEIEDAKRVYDELTKGLTSAGEIPYVSPFVNKYFLASQIARKGLKSPALQGYAKEFMEGDTAIKPEMIKSILKVGARAVPRQLSYETDQTPNLRTRQELMQQRRKRQNDGQLQLRTLQEIKRERDL